MIFYLFVVLGELLLIAGVAMAGVLAVLAVLAAVAAVALVGLGLATAGLWLVLRWRRRRGPVGGRGT
jgi:hypothetical protein